ncbi:uncharacterized protein LOC143284506 isoform X4 [Babylonia areolata]|uniref:uncharacterized protein LOC143284506 isoform X4 n=1 Tax=Babylonia areolata TaxID=304850 RepID=UPI003FD60B48
MEVFKAVADFSPPACETGLSTLLSFCKGDQFEVLDKTKTDWWGARRLKDSVIGYVPSSYLQFEERRIEKLLPDDYHEQREKQLKTFVTMQNSSHHKHPVSIYGEFGVPMDYDIPPLDPVLPADHGLLVPAEDAENCNFDTLLPPPSDLLLPPPAEELYSEVPEPVPDYHEDEDSNDFPPPPPPIVQDDPEPTSPTDTTTTATPTVIGVRNGAVSSPEEEGEQIQPRKLFNPCVVSRERQALHKELLLNYKLGKDVLQKPELNKILAKRKDTQKRKEWEEMQANKRTSLELRLEEQANRLKEKEETDKMKTISEDEKQPEFVQMHRRITHKTPTSPPT